VIPSATAHPMSQHESRSITAHCKCCFSLTLAAHYWQAAASLVRKSSRIHNFVRFNCQRTFAAATAAAAAAAAAATAAAAAAAATAAAAAATAAAIAAAAAI
jgi:hypothetical protein